MDNAIVVLKKSTPKPRLFSLFFLCALLLFCACVNPVAHSTGPTQEKSQITGNLKLSIPAIASWITASAGSGTSKGSTATRALGFVTSVKIQVQTAAGADVITPVTQNTYVTGSTMSGAATSSVSVPLIPVGSNYTVKLSVYNSSVSATTPMATGQASGVSITQGANTAVSITCVPANPTSITPSSTAQTLTLAVQAEQWYSLQITSGTNYYFLQTTPNIVSAIFNSTGALISSSSYIAYTATYTGTLYIGVVNDSSSSATAALAVSTTAPILNEGSIASPVALSLNQAHLFQLGPYNNQGTSYYSFTTDSAGTFALNSTWAIYAATLYSDSGFTTVVFSSQSDSDYGCSFTGLSASTTYYLKLTSNYADFTTFTGQIMDPAAIAAAGTHNQGSVASPLSLPLGSAISAQVGCHSYDMTSYYSFTTGSRIDYSLSATNVSPSGNIPFQLYSDASFHQYVGSLDVGSNSGSSGSLPPLSPATTYYMMASNGNNNSSFTTYTLEVSSSAVPTFISLPTDGTWTAGSLSSSTSTAWYAATVIGGQTYTLNWDDESQGSGTYTAYCSVNAYQGDRITAYFINAYQGYTTAQVINVPAGQTQVYIRVFNGTGTFALKLVEAPPSGTATVTAQ
jgi:hypothetical protein